jgi:hypothetical protein
VCDLQSHLTRYNGNEIDIRGWIVASYESESITDGRCSVSMQLDFGEMPRVEKVHTEEEKEAWHKYQEESSEVFILPDGTRLPEYYVTASFTGRLTVSPQERNQFKSSSSTVLVVHNVSNISTSPRQ